MVAVFVAGGLVHGAGDQVPACAAGAVRLWVGAAAAAQSGHFAGAHPGQIKEGHQHLARRFAASGVDRFAEGGFTQWPGGGAPCLVDAHVSMRCVALDVIPMGDHEIMVGGFVEARFPCLEDGPLLWYRRDFGSLSQFQPEADARQLG
ncbi:flavin reductase family protein [Streptomyces avermitilis]